MLPACHYMFCPIFTHHAWFLSIAMKDLSLPSTGMRPFGTVADIPVLNPKCPVWNKPQYRSLGAQSKESDVKTCFIQTAKLKYQQHHPSNYRIIESPELEGIHGVY